MLVDRISGHVSCAASAAFWEAASSFAPACNRPPDLSTGHPQGTSFIVACRPPGENAFEQCGFCLVII
jgi:hypothetical protein